MYLIAPGAADVSLIVVYISVVDNRSAVYNAVYLAMGHIIVIYIGLIDIGSGRANPIIIRYVVISPKGYIQAY